MFPPPEPYISADRPAHSFNRHEDQSASTAASPHMEMKEGSLDENTIII